MKKNCSILFAVFVLVIVNNAYAQLPRITVQSPNGGEVWEIGSSQNITWTSVNVGHSVKIEYSIDSGGKWSTITSLTQNDGTYSWTVLNTPSTDCRVRVSDVV